MEKEAVSCFHCKGDVQSQMLQQRTVYYTVKPVDILWMNSLVSRVTVINLLQTPSRRNPMWKCCGCLSVFLHGKKMRIAVLIVLTRKYHLYHARRLVIFAFNPSIQQKGDWSISWWTMKIYTTTLFPFGRFRSKGLIGNPTQHTRYS